MSDPADGHADTDRDGRREARKIERFSSSRSHPSKHTRSCRAVSRCSRRRAVRGVNSHLRARTNLF